MTDIFASLAFVAAAIIALGAMAGTVLRYRDSVMANLAAHRDLSATRDLRFQVFAFGSQPVMGNSSKVRRIGKRTPTRQPVTPTGWLAAA